MSLDKTNFVKTNIALNKIFIIVQCVLMFFYIYDINLSLRFGTPTWVTTQRIVVFIIFFGLLFIKGKKVIEQKEGWASKALKDVIVLHIFLFIYAGFLILLFGRGSGDNIIYDIIRFFVLAVLPVYLFKQMFSDHHELFKVIYIVTLAQCIIIFIGMIDYSFIIKINNAIGDVTSVRFVTESRATGLACGAAPGALKITMGLVACMYFILTSKKWRWFYILSFCFMVFTGSAVARTVLVIALIAIIFMIIRSGKISTIHAMKLLGTFVVLIGIIVGVFFASNTWGNISKSFNRFNTLMINGFYGDFWGGYIDGPSTVIPPVTWKTIIGTSMSFGMSGSGVYVHVDGGYLRLYAAYGLLLAIIFYILMFAFMFKALKGVSDKNMVYISVFMIVLIAFGEFKEYTIYKYYMVCIYYLMVALYEKYLARSNLTTIISIKGGTYSANEI